MAEIKAFRALRFCTEQAGNISELTCPPYDIISEEERLAFLEKNPHNIIRLELPRGEEPYAKAGETLSQWLSESILRRDTDPGLYLYEEEFEAYGETHRLKGFISLVRLVEFSAGVVLPHEETLSKAKADRFELMKATNCNFSQIYCLYMDEEHQTLARIDALSKDTPRYEFSDGAVTHRLWLVNDPVAIRAICEDFADRKLYIADGHHRYETALNYRNACRENGTANPAQDYVMMMLVDMQHPGLVVFPTHRLIRGLADFDSAALLERCREQFDVQAMERKEDIEAVLSEQYAQGKKAFAFYDGGEGWHLLVLRELSVMAQLLPDKSAASQGLDVTVLHSLILERMLGIDKENMAQQINLTYTRSLPEALASVQSGESQCAFLLNPTRVEEIRDVAAAGEKMPQKSTYFYPKLITGLVMNQLED
ncbi:DUF1015 domain-containing protein [Faecalispora jeddahensis]|uniref:DUF1015 domain-containing protein n=1 Tax=Faecalispora jeddahensis TaxID=1414721 RepID=UPI0004AD7A43|nr:DUF1015 domain-containing protein [Faecalispora jeddahensis]